MVEMEWSDLRRESSNEIEDPDIPDSDSTDVHTRAYDHLYADMDTTEGQKKVLRMAKEREKNSKDIYQSKVIKDEEERGVLVEDLKILERWREQGRVGVKYSSTRTSTLHFHQSSTQVHQVLTHQVQVRV